MHKPSTNVLCSINGSYVNYTIMNCTVYIENTVVSKYMYEVKFESNFMNRNR